MILETEKPISGGDLADTLNRILNFELDRDYDSVSYHVIGHSHNIPLIAVAKGNKVQYLITPNIESTKFGIFFGDNITTEMLERVKRELSGGRSASGDYRKV